MEYKSFGEYLKSLPENTIFRIWQKKWTFTPYECEEKFVDQSIYIDSMCSFIIIDDIIDLPNGDLLLAAHHSDDDKNSYTEYYRLSDISIAKSDMDNIKF